MEFPCEPASTSSPSARQRVFPGQLSSEPRCGKKRHHRQRWRPPAPIGAIRTKTWRPSPMGTGHAPPPTHMVRWQQGRRTCLLGQMTMPSRAQWSHLLSPCLCYALPVTCQLSSRRPALHLAFDVEVDVEFRKQKHNQRRPRHEQGPSGPTSADLWWPHELRPPLPPLRSLAVRSGVPSHGPSPGSEGNGTATQPTTWMGNLDSSLSLATLGKGGPLAGMGIPPELGSFRHRFPPFPETDRHARRIRYASPRDSDSG